MNGQRSGGGVEPAGGFQDADVMLGMLFGGESFRDLVGEISIGKSVYVLTCMMSASVNLCTLFTQVRT
jgi:hypothetical protein